MVLDPFAGSGTTIVGCELEARLGIGFELEAANVAIANERIAAARASVDAQSALHGQLGIFAPDSVALAVSDSPERPVTAGNEPGRMRLP